MQENRQLFAGTQDNMCEAARLGCTLFDGEQKVFEENNLMYGKQWSASFRKKIEAALNLPDIGTRRAVPSKMKDSSHKLAARSIGLWLVLSGCIRQIATEKEIDPAPILMEAGQANYEEAARSNLPKVKALLKAGSEFIAGNMEWLLNDGKSMPPAFPERYNMAFTAFSDASADFYDAKGEMPLETSSRVDAMNSVYKELTGMLGDGKKYFRSSKTMRDLFSYRSLLSKVQGTSTVCGVNITALAEGTLLPLTTTSAVFMPTGYSFIANEKGIVSCELPAGKYNVTITAPGYRPFSVVITIKSGVTGRKKFIFTKDMLSNREEAV